MGKSRMMGAGNASATLYKCDPNIPTGGGNKKQGITSRVGLDNWQNREIQTQSNGIGRFKLFFMNQLGGVEPGHSMFGGRWNRADGLSMNLYKQQLNHVTNQDKQTGIYPSNDEYYVGNRGGGIKSNSDTCAGSETSPIILKGPKIVGDNTMFEINNYSVSSFCVVPVNKKNKTYFTIDGNSIYLQYDMSTGNNGSKNVLITLTILNFTTPFASLAFKDTQNLWYKY